MPHVAGIAAPLLVRARADQVGTLYAQWHRTTLSMVLGAALLCMALWLEASPATMFAWILAILVNQGCRGLLVRAYRHARPGLHDARRWGRYWSAGSAMAGALWGMAAVAMFPASAAQQALLIVCLFGVILGGLNLTAGYKPAFYGFVLPALVPLIARVAAEGGPVHLFTALVMVVVLGFVLAYGHHLNNLLTQSLAMRYENTDLVAKLTHQSLAAEAARAAAETANRAKSQFLAAASHDLRQPMHAMGLFAAALAATAREPAVQPLVASIHTSVEALEALFGQLLDLSRLDAGALHPDLQPIALQPLFARLAAEFAPVGLAAGLRVRIVRTSAVVLTDPVLLERILRNLLANALRYTRRGGVILGVRHERHAVRIDVLDSGIGIAAADHDRVFDEFVQVSGAARSAASGHGLGLGLAIVRRLAVLLEHRLELVSAPNLGSRFSVHAARASASPRRLPVAAASCPATTTASDGPLRGRRILVIDDDAAIVAAMQSLFVAWGAKVIAASDAAEAGACLRRAGADGTGDVDLIVADLRLAQGASGIDAIAAVRRRLGIATPALIVSGDTTDLARDEALHAGITLLPKPLLAATLRSTAERALLAS